MPAIDPNPRMPDDDSLIQGKNRFTLKLTDLIFRYTPKCTEMTRLISEEMDHPLPFSKRARMQVHYLACCYCERYKKNLHFLRSFLRFWEKHSDETSTEEMPHEAKERLKRLLREGKKGP
jgi:hypothetical protein